MARRLDTGRTIGGICKLRELISEHTAEFASDFRSKFGISYLEIGYSVSWLEAIYLTSVLMKDPTSWLQASLNEWDYPVSRDWMVLAHLYDLLATVNSKKKPKPYPSPWPDQNTKRIGSKKPQKRADVQKVLDFMNPKGD
jgi:hypothetical protein